MIRKKNLFSKPRRLYDKHRILDENALVEKYGLKNKREIWKADAKIAKIRNLAKKLITSSDEKKNVLIARLQKMGFKVSNIADILGLNKEDLLKRRLQTFVSDRKLARTPKQARQLITHKHVSIAGQTVSIPSYNVGADEEDKIELNIVLKEPKKEDKIQEVIDDVQNKDLEEAAEA